MAAGAAKSLFKLGRRPALAAQFGAPAVTARRPTRSLAALLSTTVDAPTEATAAPVEKFRKDYTPLPWAVDSISLRFDLRDGADDAERATTVTARLVLSPEATRQPSDDLVLDAEDLEIKSVAIDGHGQVTGFTLKDDKLTIPSAALPKEGAFTLETVTAIAPAANLQLSGLYKSSGMFCTQCEAEGFRRITPYFDRPDVMATYECYIEADKASYPILLSNGNQVESGEVPGSEGARHFAKWEDPFKKPSYLFAVVAGDLGSIKGEYVTQLTNRRVGIEIFSEHANVDQLDHALQSVYKAMKWDEDRYGLEYDLDVYNIVAVNDFNMGAMENKGLNVFNTALTLAKPSTATDADYARIESVIGHEYFHNWSGNRVTCRDWFQLTLKEGLTVYRDQEFSADMGSAAVQRISNVRGLRAGQFAEDGGPMAHPIRPESYIAMDNFYTATVYSKGAEVIRMYEALLGREGFKKGLDLYFARHDGQAVTCDDFRAAMADANAFDLAQFERWYTQPGTPTVEVLEAALDATKGEWTVTLRQSCRDAPGPGKAAAEPFHIPVKVGLLDAATGAEVLETHLLELTQPVQTFVVGGVTTGTARVVPSILRGFSAPVRLVFAEHLKDADLAFLMEHDTDPFNKWEAAQKLAMKVLLAATEEEATSDTGYEVPSALVAAFKGSVAKAIAGARSTGEEATGEEEALDLNLAAAALSLPSLSEMSDAACEPVDPLALVGARKRVKQGLAQAAKKELEEVYVATAPEKDKPYTVDGREVGRRALRNLVLDYLASVEGPERAAAQFEEADCMTDKLAALAALVTQDPSPERTKALAAFKADASTDALVVNKWFSVQAGSGSLEEVEALLAHPDFSWTNPNRLRSVVSVFSAMNLRAFHAADGSGYALVGDAVLKVDKTNNQIAARLCGAFSLWRKYGDERGALMRAQLERIKGSEGVSKDVFEIASRSLA